MTDKGLPPLVRSWRQFYWILVVWLLLCIVFMYLFTAHYS